MHYNEIWLCAHNIDTILGSSMVDGSIMFET